jgi:hypothetical protein
MGNARNLGSLLNTSTTIQADDLNIGQLGNRNKIINGAMQVAQRGTSATSVSASGYYTCDRWNYHKDGSEIITLSQESDAPADFKYSQKILVTTADIDIPVNSMMRLEQRIEASSLRDINQGTASAKQLNVSFWVKSNKTGSFSVGMFNDNNGATISQPYTINSADAWEHKTVTFVADTSVGTLSTTDNAVGLRLWFALASGTSFNSGTPNVWSTSATHRAIGQAVNLFDATNNYWQVTGVQLEAGDTATPFEHRSYGQELALCQRYYQRITVGCYHTAAVLNDSVTINTPLQTHMRTSPTANEISVSLSNRVSTNFPPSTVVLNPNGCLLRAIANPAGRVEYAAVWEFTSEL